MSSRAATWSVEVPNAHPKPESETITDNNHSTESVIGEDFRLQVNLADFQDGGKYRCELLHFSPIVKIQARFYSRSGTEKWMMATGWLIRPDLVVTAGHVVYDKSYGYGATSQIKCYIGYNGKKSVPELGSSLEAIMIPAVQARFGSKVVTTESWINLKDKEARPHDLAFIQIHKPFVGNLNVFEFTDTVSPAILRLGVVGYPGELRFNDEKNGEKGAQMYELFDRTSIRGSDPLPDSDNDLIAIGTHSYGAGGGDPTNSGSSIGGKWGYDYNSFMSLFGQQESNFSAKFNDITYVTPDKPAPPVPGPGYSTSWTVQGRSPFLLPGQWDGTPAPLSINNVAPGKPAPPVPSLQLPFPSPHPDAEEGFFDVLKKVAKIGATVVQAGGPLFGPAGAIVGTVAGGLLGAIAGQESVIVALGKPGADPIAPGVVERAVLAEASLQAVFSLFENSHPNDPVVNKVISHMSDNYMRNAPNADALDALSTHLAPQLTECALDIANQQWNRAITEPRHSQEAVLAPLPRKALTGRPSAESGIEQGAFAEGLLSATIPLPGGEEGAFDFLGGLIGDALSLAKPLVSRAAKAVVTDLLPKVVGHVVGAITGGGKAEATLSPASSRNSEAARLIFQRALVADTAVSALSSLSRDELNTLKITLSGQNNNGQQEGIFDFIKTTIQKIGPFALNTAKDTIKHFAPVLVDVAVSKLKQLGNGETLSAAAAANGTVTAPRLRVKRQPSNLERYRSGTYSAGDFVAVSPAVSNLVSGFRGGAFARAASPTNGLVFVASRAGLHPAGALSLPQATEPLNPDQPPIMEAPPPSFDPLRSPLNVDGTCSSDFNL
ncbi:hypothetical protein FB451DRAFT_1555729 [Mycena latifolia]|nr:hypothetical protein FB451DRAFT_1555729 [Mycena latifolia]